MTKPNLRKGDTVIIEDTDELFKNKCDECLSSDDHFSHTLNENKNEIFVANEDCDLMDKAKTLTKRYSEMNDDEKRNIIEYTKKIAYKANKHKIYRNKSELVETIIDQVSFSFKDFYKKLDNGKDYQKLKLIGSDKLSEDLENDLHFRLAESQFYRLVYGNTKRELMNDPNFIYRVTSVEYVINKRLLQHFEERRKWIIKNRGEEYCKIVLGFHGTKEKNIESICRSGFRVPSDDEYSQLHDSGYYGRGVYFSQFPTYAMDYIKDGSCLLLCLLLLGRVNVCQGLCHDQVCKQGYDSHSSPSGKELVIFSTDQIYPSYIVNFVKEDISASLSQIMDPYIPRYNSKFDVILSTEIQHSTKKRSLEEEDNNSSMKKLKSSRILENRNIMVSSLNLTSKQIQQLEEIISENGGTTVKDLDCQFSLLVSTKTDASTLTEPIRVARERQVPCVDYRDFLNMLEESTFTCDNLNKFLI